MATAGACFSRHHKSVWVQAAFVYLMGCLMAAPADSLDLKGIPIGADRSEVLRKFPTQKCSVSRGEIQECRLVDETYAGMKTKRFEIGYLRNKLAQYKVDIDDRAVHAVHPIAEVISEKYGPPESSIRPELARCDLTNPGDVHINCYWGDSSGVNKTSVSLSYWPPSERWPLLPNGRTSVRVATEWYVNAYINVINAERKAEEDVRKAAVKKDM